ncbi:hypothetical protein [Chitinophaga sp. YIM B06452]|uniref:hypothetical protein n=1 Tax=Chitinophaga sp. YIM B06452 TaxID=3082158 RepID=UPI0031FE862A
MHKSLFYIIVACLSCLSSFAQDEKAVDSLVSLKSVSEVKKQFELTETEQKRLFEANKIARQKQKEVMALYRNTPAFAVAFDRVQQQKDSIYAEILGKERFVRYKSRETQNRDQFELAQRLKQQRQKDSIQALILKE